jgi:hypothetical protein
MSRRLYDLLKNRGSETERWIAMSTGNVRRALTSVKHLQSRVHAMLDEYGQDVVDQTTAISKGLAETLERLDALATALERKLLEESVWPYVQKGGEDECWVWTAGLTAYGYGRTGTVRGRRRQAHIVAYELAHGPIPQGLVVLHSCDNPPCCNPKHLSAGTQAENIADMCAKGRVAKGKKHGSKTKPESRARGSRHGSAKVTEEVVRSMRAEYATGLISLAQLAMKHAVTRTLVADIIARRSWGWLE